MSEHANIMRKSSEKREYPLNSFTIVCALELHNKSSNKHNRISNNVPHTIISVRRNLFGLNDIFCPCMEFLV